MARPEKAIDSLVFLNHKKLEIFVGGGYVKTINFNGCPEIKIILIPFADMPTIPSVSIKSIKIRECKKLLALQFAGDPATLDISQNLDLRYLRINGNWALDNLNYNNYIDNLDLCSHKRLEYLHFYYPYKNVFIPEELNSILKKPKLLTDKFFIEDWNIYPSIPIESTNTRLHLCK